VKKSAVIFALTLFTLAISLPLSLNLQAAYAQSTNYTIQHVDHNIQILHSGHIVVTDTIQITGTLPEAFQIGVPYKFGSFLLETIAYDTNYKALSVASGVQLQEQSGFYGVTISLPQGTANTLTVVFILSNNALTSTSTGFALDFPAYPGFSQTTADCNVTLTLPSGSTIVGIDKPDGVVNATSYTKNNLAAFTYAPATATFSATPGYIQKVNISSLKRQININPSGAITGTDSYRIVNNSTGSISSFIVNLPLNATNVIARDQFGRILATSLYQTNSLILAQNVTLAVRMSAGDSTDITLDYSLPNTTPAQGARYNLNLDLFAYFNYYIDSASVTITPPEGATIVAPTLSQIGTSAALSRNVFQESLTVNKQGISYVDSIIPSQDIATISFDYNSLWIAFRATSWMWVVAIVGVVIIAMLMRPKAKGTVPRISAPKILAGQALGPEHIREFTDAYEEKNKITQEIRSLEARAQHGRIPRRRYKVQRRALEMRLETIDHNIAKLKGILRGAGGTYSDIVRQLEAAEGEQNEVNMNLKNIEARHETGEIPLEAYRKQLNDLERRKEKAESTINGLLLRLRGEIQ
jgi:hypothetical protein